MKLPPAPLKSAVVLAMAAALSALACVSEGAGLSPS